MLLALEAGLAGRPQRRRGHAFLAEQPVAAAFDGLGGRAGAGSDSGGASTRLLKAGIT